MLEMSLLEALTTNGLAGTGKNDMRWNPVETVVHFSGREADFLLAGFPLDIFTKPGMHDYVRATPRPENTQES